MTRIVGLILLVLLVWTIWYLTPVVSETMACYQSHVSRFDESEFRTRAYGWSERKICEVETETLISLTQCLNTIDAKRNPKVLKELKFYAQKVISLLRYGLKDVTVLRIEHNELCRKFPDFVL